MYIQNRVPFVMSENIPRALPQQHWPYGPAPLVSAPRKSERGRRGLARILTSQKSRETSHARHRGVTSLKCPTSHSQVTFTSQKSQVLSLKAYSQGTLPSHTPKSHSQVTLTSRECSHKSRVMRVRSHES